MLVAFYLEFVILSLSVRHLECLDEFLENYFTFGSPYLDSKTKDLADYRLKIFGK